LDEPAAPTVPIRMPVRSNHVGNVTGEWLRLRSSRARRSWISMRSRAGYDNDRLPSGGQRASIKCLCHQTGASIPRRCGPAECGRTANRLRDPSVIRFGSRRMSVPSTSRHRNSAVFGEERIVVRPGRKTGQVSTSQVDRGDRNRRTLAERHSPNWLTLAAAEPSRMTPSRFQLPPGKSTGTQLARSSRSRHRTRCGLQWTYTI
jgi:hypothetical protein